MVGICSKMMATKNKLTLEEFLDSPKGDGIYELVNGEAVFKVSPKEFHSALTFALTTLLSRWAKGKGRVRLEWALKLKRNGIWVPVPEVTYISYERLPRSVLKNSACPVAPEIVIEIISPGKTIKDFEDKTNDYFNAGVLRFWVVDPEGINISVFFPDGSKWFFTGDTEIVDALLPDLGLSVNSIFQEAELL